MKNGPLFFLGLLAALAISWGAIVVGSNAQLGGLTPFYDEGESQSFPGRFPGVAARGQLVYADLGCASCHTQQVRRPGFGSDLERGWGERQSVARDYIFQPRPQLGALRLGPDLANFAGRKNAPDAADLYRFLYNGSPTHPSYRFLFEERVANAESPAVALRVGQRTLAPTERAQSLVAYLLSLNTSYVYPEARPLPPQAAEGAHGAVPAKHDEKPIPAAAPDEKKEAKK